MLVSCLGPRLAGKKMVVTFVEVAEPGGGGASLTSRQQPFLQLLRDKLVGQNALKDAGR